MTRERKNERERGRTMKYINGGVCAARGFKANGIYCGIRRNRSKRDLALIFSETPASAAGIGHTSVARPNSAATSR